MHELVEKIIFYLLGAVVGTVAGFILLSFDIMYIDNKDPLLIITITSLIGIIVYMIVHEYRTEKSVKRSNKVRNATVALITHEMRTGLTSTSWGIQLILQNYSNNITETDRKMLQNIINSIQTTVTHSINLLDVSLLDIGKLTIALKWVKLGEVQDIFEGILEKYSYGVKEKNIVLQTKVKLDPKKEAEVDTVRLRIILENLLENSMQYARGGEIKVDIENTDESMNIVVSDNGIGIPIEEQEKIFEEFYRASNARDKVSSGSGIGLFMCDQYVKAHHGTMRFESKENVGTTFYISIPLKTSANVNEFLNKI